MPTKTAALLGFPLGHSLSPKLHAAAFAHAAIDGQYVLWETPAEQLAERVAALRDEAMYGANVTLPHKLAVLPLLDAIHPDAEQVGAVNTIVRGPGGALTGYNTDVPAFLAALREDAGFDPTGRRAVVLGASGAARAALAALLGAHAASVAVVNRTLEKAEDVLGDALNAADYDPALYAITYGDPALPELLAEAELVVNATSLGWQADETPLDAALIPASALVYDMVYRQTRLLREAAARGARTQDGLTMLVRQAALAFTLWTNVEVAPEVMLRAVS
ncbi:shikimate dehydrogenase [Chloroflexia bacterium SDU3-3]|nr:shikimate dehydrogenase [Chloroflexia bacterium SDU3-3]